VTVIGGPVSISADGTISTNDAISGKLKLVEFSPTAQIQSTGAGYYTAPPTDVVPATKSQVRQATLENSNVNPVTAVVELITAQRDVDTMRRVLTMFSSELDKSAAQDLPRIS
jgi:flagellar basal body rod protein FlgG